MDRLSNQVHPMIKTLFPNNDAYDNNPIHTAGNVQSWFKSMKVNFNKFDILTGSINVHS
jgi:hypothetical protein